jgi:acetyl esterase/lipase
MRRSFFIGDVYLDHFQAQDGIKKAVVYFQGIPGPAHVQKAVNSLRDDLAKPLTEHGFDLFAPRYAGLPESKGHFEFVKILYDGASVTQFLISEGYEKICILGRSFGALVALASFSQLQDALGEDAQLILMSPVLQLPLGRNKSDLAKNWKATLPFLEHLSEDDIVRDLEIIATEWNPLPRLERAAAVTTILQAKNDSIVSAESIAKLIAPFDPRPNLIILDDDHDFLKRQFVIKELLNALNK